MKLQNSQFQRLAPILALAATLLPACSSGGGGGGSSPNQLAFTTATSSGTEGSLVSIVVRLTTDGSPLTEPVSVTLSTTGGDATEGSDTSPVNATVLTFPIGSTNGAQQTHELTLLDDANVEATSETLDLRLTSPSGAAISGQATHTVSIQDDDLATLQFGAASSATPDESAAVYSVNVRLTLPTGGALQTPVSVQFADAASGTAGSGVDYDPLPPGSLEFEAGSPSGSTQTISVAVRADTLIELDETIALQLTGVGPSARLGAQVAHVLTITEDDFGVSLTFTVDGGAPLAGGESFDLGAAVVDSGPTAGVQLELSNSGGSPIEISPLELTGDIADFSLETSGTTSGSAGALPTLAPFPATVATGALGGAGDRVLQFQQAELEQLASSNRVIMDAVPIPGGGEMTLELERLPSPWAADARVVLDGADVAGGPLGLTGDLSLWRGGVLGMDESSAFLSFSSAGSRGWIQLDGSAGGGVQLLSSGTSSAQEVETRMVWSAAYEAGLASGDPCLGTRLVPGSGTESGSSSSGLISPGLALGECRLAIETDYQLYQKFGSAAALTTYVTELVAAVSDQYERDAQVRLVIAYLGVHSTSDDGWTSQDTGGDAGNLLDEFRAAWASGSWPVQADLAHFLSGASLGGGIAYLGVLCNQTFGFGVSGNINTNIDWSGWDYSPTSLAWDFVVLAHELGHNFGSQHTQDYCPPLDNCYAGCEAAGACTRGTLMSYCHTCGGMSNIDLEFHPVVADVMRQRVASSCLGTAELQPGTTATFRLRFDPVGTTGAKSVGLSVAHNAPQTPSVFTLQLTGLAQ